MPSLPKTIRDALPDGIAEKISFTSTSAVPSHRARASVIVPGPPAPPRPPRVGPASAGAIVWRAAAAGRLESGARARAARRRLVVGEIDQLVLSEAGMQRDVHQAREAGRLDGRQSGDVLRIEDTVADDSQTTRTLGHENAAIGQKRHGKRLVEALGRDDANLVNDAGVFEDWTIGKRRRRPVDSRRCRRRTPSRALGLPGRGLTSSPARLRGRLLRVGSGDGADGDESHDNRSQDSSYRLLVRASSLVAQTSTRTDCIPARSFAACRRTPMSICRKPVAESSQLLYSFQRFQRFQRTLRHQ